MQVEYGVHVVFSDYAGMDEGGGGEKIRNRGVVGLPPQPTFYFHISLIHFIT